MNKPDIKGGIDIAMKVPSHQYQQTIDFYRNVIRLPEIIDKPPAVGFELGPNKLEQCGVVRCDAVEPLPDGFKGGWIMNPCNIVHMLREPEAW
ncbi:hypothetical protein J2T25_000919 [Citrobacter amalonaticus]|uniref:hypothetical protein n=1 Tax=Citrobacter amalonaticus TaxID=35703 RepID=UPI00209D4782|nr:hypothetical protein [Citrobacter amalonaticus]MCP1628007.1 hypothetical protein [Citrobacter amalonaticus]